MGRQGKQLRGQPRTQQPTTQRAQGAQRQAGDTDGGRVGTTRFDRLMNRAKHPGKPTYILTSAIILAALIWPRAVIDPTSVQGPARGVVSLTIAGVVGLCFSTLTVVSYILLAAGDSEASKKFTAAVLNRAGVGAALGVLGGVRVAPELLGAAGASQASETVFADYLSNVGNIVTMFTCIFIATTWIYSLPPLAEASVTIVRRIPRLGRFADGSFTGKVLPTVIIAVVNLSAWFLAWIVWVEVERL